MKNWLLWGAFGFVSCSAVSCSGADETELLLDVSPSAVPAVPQAGPQHDAGSQSREGSSGLGPDASPRGSAMAARPSGAGPNGGAARPPRSQLTPDAALDAGGVAAEPVCRSGELTCQGSLIARCDGLQSGFELMRDCRDAAFCARAASACAFDACPAEELGCSLPELLPAAEGVLSVATGNHYTCAVITGGGVRCWGLNHRGQLGYGHGNNIGDDELPASVGNVDVGAPVVQVVAGGLHTCALLSSGEVRCWGDAGAGRLGFGDTARQEWLAEQAGRSVNVGDDETAAWASRVDLGGPAIQLAAGQAFTCALLRGGDVRCWGTGLYGELGQVGVAYIGDDEHPGSLPPVELGGPAAFIAAGHSHNCAILRTGEVRCWGRGYQGRLGYGSSENIGDYEAPASAGSVALGGRAVHLSLGDGHSCAVLADGAVRCWGKGDNLALGHDDRDDVGDDELPAARPVLDLGAPAIQVAAGLVHTCALLSHGAVRCWGDNVRGALGTGVSGFRALSSAAPRVELGGDAIQIDTYADHVCAVLSTRELSCWGRGQDGNLGYGNTEEVGDTETPASVGLVPVRRMPEPPAPDVPVEPPVPPDPPSLPAPPPPDAGPPVNGDDAAAADTDAGGTAAELVCASGALRCDGSWVARCRADGTAFELVTECLDAAACEQALSRCELASCAFEDWGCAGPEPTPVGVGSVAVGEAHTCVVMLNGAVRCWGKNEHGQLGYAHENDIGDNELPASAGEVDVGGPVQQVVLGDEHTCALLSSGEVRCWGYGRSGRLGLGNEADVGDDETPASVRSVELGGPSARLAAGGAVTCALLVNGDVRCWGSGAQGKLGLLASGNVGDGETPASVGSVDLGGPSAAIATGGRHTCAISIAGEVHCWGLGSGGRLGYGKGAPSIIGETQTPASAGIVSIGGRAVQLSLGNAHTCVVLSDGAVRCWGNNSSSQLGQGDTAVGDDETPDTLPVLDLGQPALQVAAGAVHTCVLLLDGTVRCWGSNSVGQLGNASRSLEIPRTLAASRVELGGDVIQISAAGNSTCALLATHELTCWGGGANGNLGYGNTANVGDDETPASAGSIAL